MAQAAEQFAEVVKFPEAKTRAANMPRVRALDLHIDIEGCGRNLAVARFRELADKLESGELDGASCEWRRGDVVQDDAENVVVRSILRDTTVTADADWHVGTVQWTETKIVEV